MLFPLPYLHYPGEFTSNIYVILSINDCYICKRGIMFLADYIQYKNKTYTMKLS